MRQRLLREPVNPACRSGTWRAPARRAACPAIRTARQAPGATCGRHDLRAPVRQFLGAIASCAWPVTAPLRATPCPPSVPTSPACDHARGLLSRAADSSRRDLPTRPRPHARRHGDGHVPFPHPNEALMQTRTSVPSTSVPAPRRVHVLANMDVQRTSAANGIGWAWARRSSNGWPSMAAPSSPILAAAASQLGGHRHPALGAAHDHRHAGPVRRDRPAPASTNWPTAQKFGTLSYPSNAAGFYFPVEIDPTYTAAPADFGAIWSKLPRPCTCRSTTAPASTTRPPRNGWTHSSPGRDHPVPGRRGRTRRDAAAGAGPLRPDPRATPEDRDDRRGLPSESHAPARFIPATAAEYQAQLQAYAHLDPVHVFDGPNTWTQR